MSDATITVNASSNRGPLPNLQGFLMGINNAAGNMDQFDFPTVSALNPKYWRLATGAGTMFPKVQPFNPILTLVIRDVYVDTYGNDTVWNDWAQYESFLQALYAATHSAGAVITYWDVWGEPEGGTPFNGTYAQFLELYKRTHDVLKAIDDNVKIIGPSYEDFNGAVQGHSFGQFIVDLDTTYAIKLEGLSWHEFDSVGPQNLPSHATTVTQFLTANYPGYTPSYHVNEYGGPAGHLLPGWNVGYLYYLHEAGISVTARACWTIPSLWSDCYAGLDGLLVNDNATPMPPYWVARLYAGLVGQTWLTSQTDDTRAVALAVTAGNQTLTVLVGRLTSAPSGATKIVRLVMTNFPWVRTSIMIQRIPQLAAPTPLLSPIDEGTQIQTVVQGTLTLTFNTFDDGTARWIQFTNLDVSVSPRHTLIHRTGERRSWRRV